MLFKAFLYLCPFKEPISAQSSTISTAVRVIFLVFELLLQLTCVSGENVSCLLFLMQSPKSVQLTFRPGGMNQVPFSVQCRFACPVIFSYSHKRYIFKCD